MLPDSADGYLSALSGLNAHFTLDRLAAEFAALRGTVGP
jgi:hypothetical protein